MTDIPGERTTPSPASAAIGAGGHFDPDKKKVHQGPAGDGHKGDMPVLTANADGNAKENIIAPKLKVSDTLTRAFIIHQGGDNYSDTPAPMGGGGARIACGVINK